VTGRPLRVLVTGIRGWTDAGTIHDALLAAWTEAVEAGASGITVVHGATAGADTIAAQWADSHRGDGVQVEAHEADWTRCDANCLPGHRRRLGQREWCPTAGHRRNQAMVDTQPALVLAFQAGQSAGTADCIRRAHRAQLPVRKWIS